MALRRTLAKRLHNLSIKDQSQGFRTLGCHPPFISPSFRPTKPNFHRDHWTLQEKYCPTTDAGFCRRFLQMRKMKQLSTMSFPELFYFPDGEKLREKLNISGDKRLRLDGLRPPPTTEHVPDPADSIRITIDDAKKIMRCCQLQKVRSALKRIPTNSISYSEFVTVCSDVSGDRDQGLEFAKMLDEAGVVIVFGNVVLLRPDQIAKSMEDLIIESTATPNDARKPKFEELKRQKAITDQKSISQVSGELYCVLGFFIVQILGFMRLTFWELSWDVMEPICFFVTSLQFALAYMFFLRTSKEPTFEGFFQRRFRRKQKKLMELYNFDQEKYNKLCKAFYHNYDNHISRANFQDSGHGGSSSTSG